jgi:hypothetical protein
MMQILKYMSRLLCLMVLMGTLGVQGVVAQKGRFIPSGLRIGTDLVALPVNLFSAEQDKWEVTADVDFDRYLLVADYGWSSYALRDQTFGYKSNGSYFRIGPDVNFMHNDRDLNVAFFGLRYAASSFSDQLRYNTRAEIQEDIRWPESLENTSNSAAPARWAEMNAGLRIRVIQQFFLGFTLRYKFLFRTANTDGSLTPYFVPGFGKNIDADAWGFNYYAYYRIPFRKKVFYDPAKAKAEGAER